MNELLRHALMLPPQASSVAHGIDVLHYTVIIAAFVVAFLSFALIAIFLVKYRERPDRPHARRARLPQTVELGLIGFTLTAFVAWWVVGFAQYRELRTPPPNAMRIYVVAKQWMWEAVYPNGATAQDDIRVPVGQPVELMMVSRDVIHSFYVPAFRVKQDVVPGRITEAWFTAVEPGSFEILCAEFCGAGHSRMRGRVVAMAPADYARWQSGATTSDLASLGERLAAERGCLRCHTVDGSPHLGPTWRGMYGSRVVLSDGTAVIADDAYLTESMMDPLAKLHAGFQPIMPSYLGQISGGETAAIVEYIRSLR
jgi:cytochrome c oxidase subunit 2